jgi:polyhydroxyalkanoate synthesis repressor PhaR
MAPPQIVIKKYGNRRLYDTSQSRYVNLDDIAGLIRKGREVKVVDAKTGEDLSRAILMQIIAEDNREASGGLPLELLRQLIVTSDHVGREFLAWYLKSAFDAYGKVQQSFTSGFSEFQTAATSPVQSIRNFLKISGAKETEPNEMDILRKRLAELESQVKQKKPRKPAKKRTSKEKRH